MMTRTRTMRIWKRMRTWKTMTRISKMRTRKMMVVNKKMNAMLLRFLFAIYPLHARTKRSTNTLHNLEVCDTHESSLIRKPTVLAAQGSCASGDPRIPCRVFARPRGSRIPPRMIKRKKRERRHRLSSIPSYRTKLRTRVDGIHWTGVCCRLRGLLAKPRRLS